MVKTTGEVCVPLLANEWEPRREQLRRVRLHGISVSRLLLAGFSLPNCEPQGFGLRQIAAGVLPRGGLNGREISAV
jgi:hypothetical protein